MIVLSVLGFVAAWLAISSIAVIWVLYTYRPIWWATFISARRGGQ